MSLSELEMELIEAISDLKIEDKVQKFTGEEKTRILFKLQEKFVSGNPRVWWLALKYKPTSFVFERQDPYKEIINFFDKEEEVWFVIEDEFNANEQILYKTKILYVIDIIEENYTYFEYNIISENHDRFLCQTDHDEILFIDLR